MSQVSEYYAQRYMQLGDHPLYGAINNTDQLRIFMQHHVFAVWDFMSLIKAMQSHLAPATIPWTPSGSPAHTRFINQLVMEEESDRSLTGPGEDEYCSHFESYCLAMGEIGADTEKMKSLIEDINDREFKTALHDVDVPESVKKFLRFTFDVIGSNKAHMVAGALAYGREILIPRLFEHLLGMSNVSATKTPILHAYLVRHIELDGHDHGPMMESLVNGLCDDDPVKRAEVIEVAECSIDARLCFWDGIYEAIR